MWKSIVALLLVLLRVGLISIRTLLWLIVIFGIALTTLSLLEACTLRSSGTADWNIDANAEFVAGEMAETRLP
ncbi:MAG TPA: hypothetical protein PLU35_00915 [Phycisphaerales bacterium]|nr:hypothetical protein [Phycisphaerales bacterium]